MKQSKSGRIFGILAIMAGVLLIVLEINSYNRGGEIAWFWILIGVIAMGMGIYDVVARRDRST